MFPIPWNFPFRKKNGNVVNIEDAISGGGGGGSDLPSYDSEDAGKVLSVDDNGDLEWSDKVEDLATSVETIETNLGSITETVSGLNDTVEGLSETVGGLSETVSALDTDVSDVEQLAGSLATEVADNWTKESYNLYKNTIYNANHPDWDTHFSGLTFSPQQDKSIKVTGTTTEAFNKNYGYFYAKAGKTYRISNTESGISDSMEIELLGLAVSGGGFVTRFSSHNTEQVPNTYTCQADEYVYIYYKCPDAAVEIDLTLYPMVVEVEAGAPILGYKPFGYSNNDVSNQVDIINSKLPKYEVKKLNANATSIYFTVPNDGSYNVIDFYITDHTNYTALDTSVAGRATLTYEASNVDRYVTCVITKFELGG